MDATEVKRQNLGGIVGNAFKDVFKKMGKAAKKAQQKTEVVAKEAVEKIQKGMNTAAEKVKNVDVKPVDLKKVAKDAASGITNLATSVSVSASGKRFATADGSTASNGRATELVRKERQSAYDAL